MNRIAKIGIILQLCLFSIVIVARVYAVIYAPVYLPSAAATTSTEFVISYAPTTLRNNFTGNLGMFITIGGANVTVTHLGRWVVSGNSASHSLYIFDSGCAQIATVTINCSGATPGGFLYAALGSPVTLSAGGRYYVMSGELSGGDQFYDIQNESVTTTGVAVAGGGAYTPCNEVPAVNDIYVPISFKYSSP